MNPQHQSPPLSDRLTPESVCPLLTSTVFGKKGYIYFERTDSTNGQAHVLAAKGYPEGTVLVAETQTAGRGRRGRSWYSPARQGIYVSVILRPTLPWDQISRLSLVAAVAVAETLEDTVRLPARIKWPNDILIGGRKIAGILSEASVARGGIDYVITGIGININNPREEFPGDFRTDPTSVLAETNSRVSRAQIIKSLLEHLEGRYFDLLNGNFGYILKKGKDLSMIVGQVVVFDTDDGSAVGRAVDLDDNGCLVVCDDKGRIHRVISGEISVLSPGERLVP